MDPEQILSIVIFTLFFVLVALGLFYIGVRRSSLKWKQIAVMAALVPVINIGVEVTNYFDVFRATEFRGTMVVGHDGGTQTDTFPVNNAAAAYQIEITPQVWGGDPPTSPVRLHYLVKSPHGQSLAEGDLDFAPSPTKPLYWSPQRIARLQPSEVGQHSLTLTGPPAVGTVNIVYTELKK